MPYDSDQIFGGYDSDSTLPNIWDFPGGLKPGEKESPANPENKGKSFLNKFLSGLGGAGDAFSKYQQQATRGQSSGGGSSSSAGGEYGGQLTDNLSYLYTPGYAPFTVQGQQGQPGILGSIVSAGASLGSAAIAAGAKQRCAT